MITVQLDELGYFTGSYAKIGSIPNGILVGALPSDLSNYKTTCYKWGEYETEVQVPIEVQTPVIDETTGEQKIDEQGNLVFETAIEIQTQKETRVGWIFDEEKHMKILEKIENYIPPKTDKEKIQTLQQENQQLAERMSKTQEMSATQEKAINILQEENLNLIEMFIDVQYQLDLLNEE